LPPVYKLTRREAEIARWLAAGKTNSEISSILVANVRTVEKHMESILTKLGVENRTTAAIFLAKALDPDHAALPTGNGGRDVDGFPDGEAANGAG
jgi:DNA-binding CsgD family transcriptional regulator